MGDHTRKPPAIPRPQASSAYPRFASYSFFDNSLPPVIPIRLHQLRELDVAPRLVFPQFFPLVPSVEVVVAASPVIAFSYGLYPLAALAAFVSPAFLPFPYWQEPPAPANPVPNFRYGQGVLESLSAWVVPRFQPFPYPSAAPSTTLMAMERATYRRIFGRVFGRIN